MSFELSRLLVDAFSGLVLSYDGCCSESDSEGEEAEGDRRDPYAPWCIVEEEAGYGD